MPYGRTPSPRKGTGGWSSRAAHRRAQRMKKHAKGGYISVDPSPKCKPN